MAEKDFARQRESLTAQSEGRVKEISRKAAEEKAKTARAFDDELFAADAAVAAKRLRMLGKTREAEETEAKASLKKSLSEIEEQRVEEAKKDPAAAAEHAKHRIARANEGFAIDEEQRKRDRAANAQVLPTALPTGESRLLVGVNNNESRPARRQEHRGIRQDAHGHAQEVRRSRDRVFEMEVPAPGRPRLIGATHARLRH